MADTIKTKQHRPDIDGLRAVAILPVILFHARLGCPGGFVGVDVFFVISGYLITSLILKEMQAGTFNLFHFWERRIRRILPALVAVVLASLVACWFWFLPRDFEMAGKSAIAQALLVSNFFFWSQAGYFDAASETKPLLHTWSLAVEEQFYLFFPLLLIFLARRRLPLVKAIAWLAVVSFAASVYCTYAHASFNFFWLPTRAWELMIGALTALARGQFPASRKTNEILGWLGVFLIVLVVFLYDENTRFPGLAAVAPCVGTAMIIISSESSLSQVGRVLALKPVVFVGLISYSLYLWHWPLLVFCRYWSFEEPSGGLRAALLAASGILAVFSWKYIEIPIRKRLVFQSRRQIFSFAACAGLVMFATGFSIFLGRGFPARIPNYAVHYTDGSTNAAFQVEISLTQAMAGEFVELGSMGSGTNQPVNLLIWGDSHAMSLIPVLDELCLRHSWAGIQATHSSTAPVLGYCCTAKYSLHEKAPQFNNAVLDYIARNHVPNVIIAAFWSSYLRDDPGHAESFKTQLLKTVRAVMDTGAKVYVIKDIPEPGFDVPRYISLAEARGRPLDSLGVTVKQYQLANEDLKKNV